ncbi:MAG: hypothetical protein ACFE9Z_06395 [Promethearchaeota archaeon]
MEKKLSQKINEEIDDVLNKILKWENFFNIKTELYYDGWAIFLREKNAYPRIIILFKSYDNNNYSIKSFEVHLKNYQKEEFKELYTKQNINNLNDLLKELKDVIYGKDLIQDASKIFSDTFTN